AVVAVGLLVRARRTRNPADARAVGWMASGGLLFLPWLPTFLFQLAHTGTPWGVPAGFAAVLTTVSYWSGGIGATARTLAVRLPRRLGTAVLAVAVVTGMAGAVPHAFSAGKTQAPVVAEALKSQALPGDFVVYCPDQLGPATSRLLPGSLHQEVYPTGGSPTR